jgi:hypothetical protein
MPPPRPSCPRRTYAPVRSMATIVAPKLVTQSEAKLTEVERPIVTPRPLARRLNRFPRAQFLLVIVECFLPGHCRRGCPKWCATLRDILGSWLVVACRPCRGRRRELAVPRWRRCFAGTCRTVRAHEAASVDIWPHILVTRTSIGRHMSDDTNRRRCNSGRSIACGARFLLEPRTNRHEDAADQRRYDTDQNDACRGASVAVMAEYEIVMCISRHWPDPRHRCSHFITWNQHDSFIVAEACWPPCHFTRAHQNADRLSAYKLSGLDGTPSTLG